MTTTREQSELYAARIIAVGVAWVALPFLPIAFAGWIPERFQWIPWLWIPLGFYLWARLARRLLVKVSYTCPQCNQQQAQMEVVKGAGDVFLTCRSCGFREKSKFIAWGDGTS